MTTHMSGRPTTIDDPELAHSASRPRGWIVAGLAAGITSVAGLVIGSGLDAVYADSSRNHPDHIAEAILDSAARVAAFHTATSVAALLLVVFAVGLRRLLLARTPVTSLLPEVASLGLVITSVIQIMGTSLDTEFTQGARGNVTPDAITFYGHWVNTVPWCWAGTGLTALAMAFAAFRYRALPRWMALVCLVLGAATTLFAVSPLEYMAAMSGALWLLVVPVGLLSGAKP